MSTKFKIWLLIMFNKREHIIFMWYYVRWTCSPYWEAEKSCIEFEGGAINLLEDPRERERVIALTWVVEIQMCSDVLHQVVW